MKKLLIAISFSLMTLVCFSQDMPSTNTKFEKNAQAKETDESIKKLFLFAGIGIVGFITFFAFGGCGSNGCNSSNSCSKK